ncbi:MAG: ATP-binding protein [Elusimicrobiales bacterium]
MKLLAKLLLFFVPLTLLLLGTALFASRRGMHAILLGEVRDRGLAQISVNSRAFSAAFETGSEAALLPLLQSLKEQVRGVQTAALDGTGKVLAHTNVMEKSKTYSDALTVRMLGEELPVFNEIGVKGEPVLEISAPVWREEPEKEDFLLSAGNNSGKRRLGTILLGIPLTHTIQLQDRLFMRQTALFILAVGGCSLILVVYVALVILRPARRLASGIAKVSLGEYGLAVPAGADDELGQLTRAFNLMSANLKNTTVSRDRLIEEAAERKRVEAALLYSDERFRQVSERSGDWIWETDSEGRYTYSSPVAQAILGYKPEELKGRYFHDFFIPTEKANLLAECARIMSANAIFSGFISKRTHKDGHEVILETSGGPVLNGSGALAGYRGVNRDITQRRKLEAAMIQSEKMSAIGQLAAGVAHEINNPLGIILGFAQSAARGVKEGERLAMPLKTIEREAIRCKDLVQNLLVFSRSSKQSAPVTELDLNTAVEGALSMITAQTKTCNVELSRQLASGLPKIFFSAVQVQQIVINLANNSIDAMPKGGTLTVGTALSGLRPGCVELRVRDTGEGIPKERREKIFEPFFTTKEVGKGTGLGLSLVYEIVHNHGGVIELESEEGKGSCFTILLPIQPPPASSGRTA